jgi:flavodoxin
MNDASEKTLIVYYSFTGNNEKLARHLQRGLNCDVAKIEPVRKRNGFSILLDLVFGRKPEVEPVSHQLDGYDHAIFVAPVWGGKIAMPMMSFLVKERSSISQYSFATLCNGSLGQKEKMRNELVLVLQKEPRHLVELWVNDLLPARKKDTIRYASGFRIQEDGFDRFEAQLKGLVGDTGRRPAP